MEYELINQVGWRGQVSAALDVPALLALLADPDTAATLVRGGRNALYRATLPGAAVDLAIKCFPVMSRYDRTTARGRGSKAERSWCMAVHLEQAGAGTPRPLAYLDHEDGRSVYITEWVEDPVSLKDELIRQFRQVTDCEELMDLLEVVARGVRAMHDAGLQHNDLGNQNILLVPGEAGRWENILLIDLNRARLYERLTDRQRARDVSRLTFPSDIRRVFIEMLYAPERVPREFKKAEQRYRLGFALHTLSRPLRHPIRSRRQQKEADPKQTYPSLKDVWIWDPRSVQAVSPMRKFDRLRFFPLRSHVDFTLCYLSKQIPLQRAFRKHKASAFVQPVEMAGRVSLALEGSLDSIAHEEALLQELGPLPILVRFYHHEDAVRWSVTTAFVRRMHEQGYPVSIALVQDRMAVRHLDSWRAFVSEILEATQGVAERLEIGHAINRAKWGVWDVQEYRDLVRVVVEEARRFPALHFMGPAVIDFEYHYLPAALMGHHKDLRFSALSHHLYVDRRGAPENKQGAFTTLDKLAMLKAAASISTHCEDHLIVSEVNWPLLNTGIYSPVMSPYESPGARLNDPSVDEETYTDFMLRYLLICLCSGLADQVYWWRLAAHGFGLVDDRAEGAWRRRPAFFAFKTLVNEMRDATFLRKDTPEAGIEVYWFEKGEGKSPMAMAYSRGEPVSWMPGGRVRVMDALGNGAGTTDSVLLGARPLYLYPSEMAHA